MHHASHLLDEKKCFVRWKNIPGSYSYTTSCYDTFLRNGGVFAKVDNVAENDLP
jgi:hypothetical protein